jgi:antitoxin component YwqK of YwqJK toxin-antitoxin module
MERQAQYLNKFILLIWLAIMVGTVYISAKPRAIPATWLNANNMGIAHVDGFLFYNNQLFSGWLYEEYTNGNKARATPYFEGKEEGVMKSWYPDQKLEQERLYVSGKKEGIHRGWWQNGNPKFEYEFEDDEHNGTAKEWFGNNKLYRLFHYIAGHEEGSQKMWWDDGKVRANYVVKDGVQYGLIGRKLCKNDLKNEKP